MIEKSLRIACVLLS